LWPKELKQFAKQVERLVDFLSDDHDLAMLGERVLEISKQSQEPHADEALLALIDKRRAELRQRRAFWAHVFTRKRPTPLKTDFTHTGRLGILSRKSLHSREII
jgi:hypothetical protein